MYFVVYTTAQPASPASLRQLHVDLAVPDAARWGVFPGLDSIGNEQMPEAESFKMRCAAPAGTRPLADILSDPLREYAVEGTVHIPRHAQTLPYPLHLEGDWRPEFARFLEHEYAPVYTASMAGGRVVGLGNIVSPDNYIVDDATPNYDTGQAPDKVSLLAGRETLPPATFIDGRVLVLSATYCDTYYHWLYHVLPKAALLRDVGGYDKVYARAATGFQQETLRLIGIPEAAVIPASPAAHIQARELVFSSYLSLLSEQLRSMLLHFIRDCCRLSSAAGGARKLYISRQDAANGRTMVNEDELMGFLAAEGFDRLVLSEFPFQQQVAIFSSAGFIVGPHGSGMGNAVFSAAGTRMIEIFDPSYVHPCMWRQTANLGIHYAYVLGTGPEHKEQPFFWRLKKPMHIDLDKFRRIYKAVRDCGEKSAGGHAQ